jgi:hypothetical protein
MALSLDSIHQPLNDFFLNHFKTDAGSPVVFRFDKFGSVISDADFIDPNRPDLGYSANLATEKFSDLVNRVPIEDADGLNIFISQAQIDQIYEGLLGPALPFIRQGADDQTKESIITSFSSLKSEAVKLWETIKLESSTGLMLDFKPSFASPRDWYDKTKKDNWTSHSFNITEPATSTPVDNGPRFQLWRKKIDDATMANLVPSAANAQLAAPARLATTLLVAHPTRPAQTTPSVVNTSFRFARPLMAVRFNPVTTARVASTNISVDRAPANTTAVRFDLGRAYLREARTIPVNEKIAVLQYIKSNAPTQPATTNNISVSFDYCVVNISRPWYRQGFLNDTSWFIPNKTKGELTAPVDRGANLILLPVAAVAIKNLSIQAQWPAADIASSQEATEFGPFKVDSGIVNNTLSHEGIQIIGWLLERMPTLPPNDPPSSQITSSSPAPQDGSSVPPSDTTSSPASDASSSPPSDTTSSPAPDASSSPPSGAPPSPPADAGTTSDKPQPQ